jgi:hypothetical protein
MKHAVTVICLFSAVSLSGCSAENSVPSSLSGHWRITHVVERVGEVSISRTSENLGKTIKFTPKYYESSNAEVRVVKYERLGNQKFKVVLQMKPGERAILHADVNGNNLHISVQNVQITAIR